MKRVLTEPLNIIASGENYSVKHWNREHVWACAHMKLNGKDARPDEDTKSHATDFLNLCSIQHLIFQYLNYIKLLWF